MRKNRSPDVLVLDPLPDLRSDVYRAWEGWLHLEVETDFLGAEAHIAESRHDVVIVPFSAATLDPGRRVYGPRLANYLARLAPRTSGRYRFWVQMDQSDEVGADAGAPPARDLLWFPAPVEEAERTVRRWLEEARLGTGAR